VFTAVDWCVHNQGLHCSTLLVDESALKT